MSKNKQPNRKNGQKIKIDISPKKTYRRPKRTQKDALHHYLTNATKATVRGHLTLVRTDSSKSLQTVNAGEGAEAREPSYTADGKRYIHCRV